MSHDNVEIVRRGNELLNEGNWDELFDLYHPDVAFCDLAPSEEQGLDTRWYGTGRERAFRLSAAARPPGPTTTRGSAPALMRAVWRRAPRANRLRDRTCPLDGFHRVMPALPWPRRTNAARH